MSCELGSISKIICALAALLALSQTEAIATSFAISIALPAALQMANASNVILASIQQPHPANTTSTLMGVVPTNSVASTTLCESASTA